MMGSIVSSFTYIRSPRLISIHGAQGWTIENFEPKAVLKHNQPAEHYSTEESDMGELALLAVLHLYLAVEQDSTSLAKQ